jgi:threonine aldolase
MTVCLSKGLGAPIGSLVFGTSTFINKARRWRKVLGGGMRQVGILAAAGKVALSNNIVKLKDDHRNAIYLAQQLNKVNSVSVDVSQVQTNMVFIKVDKNVDIYKVALKLKQKNILVTPSYNMRLVTHLDISTQDIDMFVKTFKALISNNN